MSYHSIYPFIIHLTNLCKNSSSADQIRSFVGLTDLIDPHEADRQVKEILKRYGLPNEPFTNLWRLNAKEQKPSDRPQSLILNHLCQILKLETMDPGICRFLWEEFGIVHFARYPTRLLIRQRMMFGSNAPYGVIMCPYSDHNGAFETPLYLNRLFHDVIGKLEIRVAEVDGLQAVVRKLIRFKQQYNPKNGANKIKFFLLGGHGNQNDIQFGTGREPKHLIAKKDAERTGIERLPSFFARDATIILQSCTTGVEGGIAEVFSQKIPDATIHAPTIPTNISSIRATRELWRHWKFDVKYTDPNPNAPSAYRAGTKIE